MTLIKKKHRGEQKEIITNFFSNQMTIVIIILHIAQIPIYILLKVLDLISIKMVSESFIITILLMCLCLYSIKCKKVRLQLIALMFWSINIEYTVSELILNREDIVVLWPFSKIYIVGITIWFLIWVMLYIVFNNINIAFTLGSCLLILLGMIDHYITAFRGSGIGYQDIYAVGTALNVSGSYNLGVEIEVVLSFVLIFFLVVCWIYFIKEITPFRLNLKLRGALFFLECLLFILILMTDVLQYIGIEAQYYRNYNGVLLNLITQANDQLRDSPPEGYSLDKLQTLFSQYTSDYSDAKLAPNVVVIMNESFADLSVLGEIETEQEIFPTVKSLSENTYKGQAYSPALGGGTTNVEYEFLTSDTLLGIEVFPYGQLNGTGIGTLPEQFKKISALKMNQYNVIALHPYYPSGWRRDIVYKILGFDKFYSLDDYSNLKSIRSYEYASDKSQYEKIKNIIEDSEQPIFAFNVTIQNHGDYSDRLVEPDKHNQINILNDNLKLEEVQIYIDLLHESDAALGELISYFGALDEPTVLCMFGDHQPILPEEFYTAICGKNLQELKEDKKMAVYKIPFIIWANYDIGEGEIDDISINYLSAVLLHKIGLPLTAYQKYLLDLCEKYPIVTNHGIIDSDSRYYDVDSVPKEIQEYKNIVYSHWKDGKNRNNSFFYLLD